MRFLVALAVFFGAAALIVIVLGLLGAWGRSKCSSRSSALRP